MKVNSGQWLIKKIIDESPELINGLSFKEILVNLFQRLEEHGFSRNYISILIHKLTVNRPARITLGEAGDFFYTKDEQYFLYNENEDIEVFHYDKELAKKTTKAYQDIRAVKYDEFINSYKESAFQLPEVKKTGKKILIVAQCSKSKRLLEHEQRAIDLYDGMEMNLYKKFLNSPLKGMSLLESNEVYKNKIDFYILSAGYGLIEGTSKIHYYNNSFNSIDKRDAVKFGRDTKVRKTLDELITTNKYDLVFMCLSRSYLNILDLKIDFNYNNSNIIFLTSKKVLDCTIQRPMGKNVWYMFVKHPEHTSVHNVPQIALKGKVLTTFIIKNGLDKLSNDLNHLQEYINSGAVK